MQPRTFLWWGSEIEDFDAMCRERGWISREEIENYVLEMLPIDDPNKVRMEVPTDYWSDLENPNVNTAGEIDLLELEGIAHYSHTDVKIEFEMVARMERGEDSDMEWKVWKMQKKYA